MRLCSRIYKKHSDKHTTVLIYSVSQCTDTYTQKRIRPGNLLPWKCPGRKSKKAATYSPALHCSTIGAGGLNCSVRNGKRWNTAAIATRITLNLFSNHPRQHKKHTLRKGRKENLILYQKTKQKTRNVSHEMRKKPHHIQIHGK